MKTANGVLRILMAVGLMSGCVAPTVMAQAPAGSVNKRQQTINQPAETRNSAVSSSETNSAGTVASQDPSGLGSVRTVDGVRYASEEAAVASCPAAPAHCVVIIPPDYGGADLKQCAPENVSMWDLRAQTWGKNATHYSMNIWDGCPASKWITANTGGLARAKYYVGYAAQDAREPGETAETILLVPYSGQWPAAGRAGNVEETLGVVTLIEKATDTLTNATRDNSNAIVSQELFMSPIGRNMLLNDVRAATASIASGEGGGQLNSGVAFDAVAMNLPPSHHVASSTGLRGEDPAGGRETVGLSGNVSVEHGNRAIKWVSGDRFAANVFAGFPIVVGGVTYVVAQCALGGMQCALDRGYEGSSSGSVAYSFAGRLYSAWNSGNQRYDATSGAALSDPLGGGGVLLDAPSGGSPVQQKIWFRDLSAPRNPDGTLSRMGYYMGLCPDSRPGMVWTNSAGQKQACVNSEGTIFVRSVSTKGPTSLGSTTVSLLPPPQQNAGAMMYVTDSNGIEREGQRCQGGSSNKALAFSNGVEWKCF